MDASKDVPSSVKQAWSRHWCVLCFLGGRRYPVTSKTNTSLGPTED